MLDRVISHEEWLAVIDELGRTRRIVGPVRREGRFFYDPVTRADQLALEFDHTVYSPKPHLFPPTETLFEFERRTGRFKLRPHYDVRATVLVGIHPCDLHAIALLDRVFENDHHDEHYWGRRRNTLLIGTDCPQACNEHCFCVDMRTHHADHGFDVMMYPLGGVIGNSGFRWGLMVGSDSGRELLLNAKRAVVPSAEDERDFKSYLSRKHEAFAKRIPGDVDSLPALLDHSFDSLIWEATAKRCYSCGSCNLVCPTCYCFNMRDQAELDGQSGSRLREWDGCQLSEFAVVAGPHNFRPKAAARLRHRIYRKGKWIRDHTGLAGCVGCGRCDRACTAKISIVEIFTQLAEEN